MQKNIIRIEEEKEDYLADLSEECYILSTGLREDYCRRFILKAEKEERIVLFYGEGAVERAKLFGADGVVLDLGADGVKEKLAEVRKILGKGKIAGLFTRNRRHESMLVSEAEPDFVIFKIWKDGFLQVKELVDWYADFFLIQSAVWEMEDGLDLSGFRADFVISCK